MQREATIDKNRTSKSFVKKKAALTLLRLYRKYPGIVQQEWAERIISLMDDPDMGVCLSVTSLVMTLAQDQPDQYKGAYVKAAQRLRRIVVDNDIAPDYLYYKVPCPWIQVKLLRLMQYFPPSGKIQDLNVTDRFLTAKQKTHMSENSSATRYSRYCTRPCKCPRMFSRTTRRTLFFLKQ